MFTHLGVGLIDASSGLSRANTPAHPQMIDNQEGSRSRDDCERSGHAEHEQRVRHAASFCSMGVVGYDAMKSTIRRAVFKVRERSAFKFVIRFASPIERRPNVDGLSACFEQNRSIWARMSASLASVVTMTEV
ncbi:hypothetical protein ASE89_14440 [Sphingomonas sp. Leaf30]|nr:hypothetical protein ASE89_14440 [Sphingomonas sp. Leaf30]